LDAPSAGEGGRESGSRRTFRAGWSAPWLRRASCCMSRSRRLCLLEIFIGIFRSNSAFLGVSERVSIEAFILAEISLAAWASAALFPPRTIVTNGLLLTRVICNNHGSKWRSNMSGICTEKSRVDVHVCMCRSRGCAALALARVSHDPPSPALSLRGCTRFIYL